MALRSLPPASPHWQGSNTIATAAADRTRPLLASNRPIPSGLPPNPLPALGVGGWVPWRGWRAHVLLPTPPAFFPTPPSPPGGGGGGVLAGVVAGELLNRKKLPARIFLYELFGLSKLVLWLQVFPFACSCWTFWGCGWVLLLARQIPTLGRFPRSLPPLRVTPACVHALPPAPPPGGGGVEGLPTKVQSVNTRFRWAEHTTKTWV